MAEPLSLGQASPEQLPAIGLHAVAEGAGFDDVRAAAGACRACDLWQRATQTVFGAGPVPAPLMLVGEQPGDREDIAGRPFVGPAGRRAGRGDGGGRPRPRADVRDECRQALQVAAGAGSKRRLHERPDTSEVGACLPGSRRSSRSSGRASSCCSARPQPRACSGRPCPSRATAAGRSAPTWRRVVMATVHPSSILRAGARRAEARRAFVADLRAAREALEASPNRR